MTACGTILLESSKWHRAETCAGVQCSEGYQEFCCAVGDRLFTLVQGLQPDKDSAKITGMLLEMSEAEILHILDDSDALVQKASSMHALGHH